MNNPVDPWVWSWQAIAAWVGATLGVLNLIGALLARRPRLEILPYPDADEDTADRHMAVLRVTASARPLHLRGITLIPWAKEEDRVSPIISDMRASIAATFEWSFRRRFNFYLPAGETADFTLRTLLNRRWRLAIVYWSDGSWQPIPFTVWLLTAKGMAKVNSAMRLEGSGAKP